MAGLCVISSRCTHNACYAINPHMQNLRRLCLSRSSQRGQYQPPIEGEEKVEEEEKKEAERKSEKT